MTKCLSSGHMTFIQRRINVDAMSRRYSNINATLYKRQVPIGFVACTNSGNSDQLEKLSKLHTILAYPFP